VNFSIIISIISFLIGLVNAYFLWVLFDKISKLTKTVDDRFSELDLDNQLNSMFSEESSGKNIDNLTKMVFENVKSKFDLRARSYNEILSEIKGSKNISLELKELLDDFFSEVIRISYRAESITDFEKNTLRQKIKLIFRILHKTSLD